MVVPERTNWPAIALLVLAGVSGALEYAKVSTVFDAVARQYSADAAAASWFVSLPALITIVFGLTGSVIAARVGFRRTVIVSLGLGAVFSSAQALLPTLPWFILLRVLDGAVQLGIVIAGPVLILQFAAPRARAFAMALWGSFFGSAFALAGWVAPLLLTTFGLGTVFLAHALFSAAILGAIVRWMPRRPGDGPQAALKTVGFLREHAVAYRLPRAVLPGAVFIFHTALYAVFVLMIPMFVNPAAAAVLLVGMPLISIVGTLLSGVLTSRWVSPPVVLMFGFASMVASLVVFSLTRELPVWPLVMPLVLMTFSGLVQGASFSLMPALSVDPVVTAQSNGVLMQLGNLGTLIGPPMFAAVVGVLAAGGLERFSWLTLACCVGGVAVSGVALRLTGNRPVSA